MIPTLILRHPKEKLSKCSLEPLRGRDELAFLKARETLRIDATGFILLAVNAPVLSINDKRVSKDENEYLKFKLDQYELGFSGQRPLLLLDSTWRLLYQLEACIEGEPLRRSLPGNILTAYPRISKIAKDPLGGLASVEALYLARKILGDDDPTLLNNYHWRDTFINQSALQ